MNITIKAVICEVGYEPAGLSSRSYRIKLKTFGSCDSSSVAEIQVTAGQYSEAWRKLGGLVELSIKTVDE